MRFQEKQPNDLSKTWGGEEFYLGQAVSGTKRAAAANPTDN